MATCFVLQNAHSHRQRIQYVQRVKYGSPQRCCIIATSGAFSGSGDTIYIISINSRKNKNCIKHRFSMLQMRYSSKWRSICTQSLDGVDNGGSATNSNDGVVLKAIRFAGITSKLLYTCTLSRMNRNLPGRTRWRLCKPRSSSRSQEDSSPARFARHCATTEVSHELASGSSKTKLSQQVISVISYVICISSEMLRNCGYMMLLWSVHEPRCGRIMRVRLEIELSSHTVSLEENWSSRYISCSLNAWVILRISQIIEIHTTEESINILRVRLHVWR